MVTGQGRQEEDRRHLGDLGAGTAVHSNVLIVHQTLSLSSLRVSFFWLTLGYSTIYPVVDLVYYMLLCTHLWLHCNQYRSQITLALSGHLLSNCRYELRRRVQESYGVAKYCMDGGTGRNV